MVSTAMLGPTVAGMAMAAAAMEMVQEVLRASTFAVVTVRAETRAEVRPSCPVAPTETALVAMVNGTRREPMTRSCHHPMSPLGKVDICHLWPG